MHTARNFATPMIIAAAALASAGCRSVQGTYIDPQRVRHGEEVGGVPVVVERPRWLKVTEKTTTCNAYARESIAVSPAAPVPPGPPTPGTAEAGGGKPPHVQNPGASAASSVTTKMSLLNTFERTSFETQIISVGELYALDMLRPFSGSSDHALEMLDAGGHLKSVKNKIDDSTFKDVLANLPGIQSFITGFGGNKPGLEPAPGADIQVVTMGERITRVQFFDLQDLANGIYKPVLVLPAPNGLCAPPCPGTESRCK